MAMAAARALCISVPAVVTSVFSSASVGPRLTPRLAAMAARIEGS